jgi:hypothetical protein
VYHRETLERTRESDQREYSQGEILYTFSTGKEIIHYKRLLRGGGGVRRNIENVSVIFVFP